jgi:predicted nucleic acid-binding protein
VRIAVDTNVFSALLSGGAESAPEARIALENAHAAGTLVVSPAVYAEFTARRSPGHADTFFSEKGVEVDWHLGREVWRTAGSRYGAYARARRRQRGDAGPRRILADFLIGAHALHFARALLTSDTGIYGTYFPELRVVSPREPENGFTA